MRYILVIVWLLLAVGALAFTKFSQISMLIAAGKDAEQAGPPPEAVSSAVAEARSWERTLSSVGSIVGVKSVDVSNDTAGIVDRIHFESGEVVEQGQLLVELDTSVERAELASSKARLDHARVTVRRSRALVAEGVLAQAQLDDDEAELKRAKADLAALEARVERSLVRAPFSGRVGVREVDVGQYLSPGTRLIVLEALGGVFVDFTLPQQSLERVAVGMPIRVMTNGTTETSITGTITALDPRVDDATRSFKVRGSVKNPQGKLRPGMFANVDVVLPKQTTVVVVPVTAIVHAPYGDSVFVIQDKKTGSPGMDKTKAGKPVKIARQKFVRVGDSQGDFVAIDEGLTAGERVVTAGAFKLRNGSPVVIDNTVKPDPQLKPRPENR